MYIRRQETDGQIARAVCSSFDVKVDAILVVVPDIGCQQSRELAVIRAGFLHPYGPIPLDNVGIDRREAFPT